MENLTPSEIQFKKVMGIMALFFLIFALLYGFAPEHLIRGANAVGGLFKLPKAPVPEKIWEESVTPILDEGKVKTLEQPPLALGRAYVAQSISLMILLATLSLLCFLNPKRWGDTAQIVLLGTALNTIFALLVFFLHRRYFGNLSIAIFNLPIFCAVLFAWLRARADFGTSPGTSA
jgi:hypothetical protein